MHLIYIEHLKNIAARAAFVVIMLKSKQLMAAMFVQNHAASVPQVCRKCAAKKSGSMVEYQRIW